MEPDEQRAVLAQNIRTAAKHQGMALSSIADFAGVSRSQLYDVLAGRKSATVDWLARIGQALEVEPWELLRKT